MPPVGSSSGRGGPPGSASARHAAGGPEEGGDRNPFILPSDEDVFKMRELERRKKEEQRHAHKSMRIWEKTEYSSTLTNARKAIGDLPADVDPVSYRKARESKGLVTAATAAIARDRRRERESMADFVSKKREMFLVQMSLDIKREEIAKLEHKAAQKEEALKRSELMLEEDAIRFDAFLKENDQQAHDALKKAEAQAKLKAERLHELKKLRHAIGLVTAEKGKLKEVLDDYKLYKEFLDSMTPEEWTQEMVRQRDASIEARRVANFEEKVRQWEEGREEKETEIAARVEMERRVALRQGRVAPRVDIAALVTASLPSPPELEDEPTPPLLDGEQELPMYFTRPEQLLEIFTQLEESNLFLIQNCQDTEQQLEELRQMYAETAAAMARQTAALEESMSALQTQVSAEESKASALRKRITDPSTAAGGAAAEGIAGKEAAGGSSAMEAMLPELRTHIVEVYELCGFKATASSDTISMLTQLEGKLEMLLSQLSTMEPEYVSLKEKEKEKERRAKVREMRVRAQHEAHEQRLKKMLERAQAPVKKREGKPVMFRSAPIAKKAVVARPDPAMEQEKEDSRFFQ